MVESGPLIGPTIEAAVIIRKALADAEVRDAREAVLLAEIARLHKEVAETLAGERERCAMVCDLEAAGNDVGLLYATWEGELLAYRRAAAALRSAAKSIRSAK